jgi:tetratricopeptide (TPR) repeat protein
MDRKRKTAAYLATAILAVLFAGLYLRQHALLLRPGQGSKVWMFTFLALSVLSAGLLGLLCIIDAKSFFGGRVEQWMVEGSAPTAPIPELEEAHRVRGSGDPLEAIRLLREYLQINPYELHVMSRIAEIYRYDLNNDLAAALEYEELLKHKLPDDQWAWAALHLAKLYGRLNELDKSVALLEKLDNKYSHTVAGKRAQKALQAVRDPESKGLAEAEDSEAEAET